ncbi:MAG: cation:proton antiporter [Methyloligella sp. ZOD6]
MEENLTSLTEIAVVALVAVGLGLFFVRLRQPPVVGYILAGMLLGPTVLGLVSHGESVRLLAELGVLLLMFLIGMELSIRAFVTVLKPAAIVASLQIVAGLAIAFLFGSIAGWSVEASLLIGFAVAVSSTALAIKMLEEIGELRADTGRITVGVLIAQDIAIVPILLFANSLGGPEGMGYGILFYLALAIGGLFLLIWALNKPGRVPFPFADRIQGRIDLLTLAMFAACFTGAAVTGLIGLSPVYGAFVAGLVVGKTALRSEAIHATEPVQSLLMVIFFLSIGLLMDLNYIVENFGLVFSFVLGVILIKSILNVVLLRIAGERWEVAFPAGLVMAQVGEFSFVLATVGLANGAMDGALYQLTISVIAISLLVSPLWLVSVRRFHIVASRGVSSFKDALAEVYEGEIAGMEKGAAAVSRGAQHAKRWGLAAKVAVQRRRSKTQEGEPPQIAFGRPESSEAEPPAEASPEVSEETGKPPRGEPPKWPF